MAEQLCGEPHPFTPISCMKKEGHDTRHWFAATWDSDEEEIESLVNHLASTIDNRARDEIRASVDLLVERRSRWL